MVGRDENSSVDMGKAIAGARRIIAETGASVILVHHSAKDSTRGMRGHSSLLGASDVVIEVKKEHAMRSFTVTKCKEGPDGVSRYFDLRSMTLRHDQDGDPVTSCVVDPAESPTLIPNKPKGRPNQARQHILETMKRLADLSPDGGVALKILREEAGKDKGPNYRNTWYDNYPILLTSHMLREDAGIVYQVNDKA